MKCKCGHKLKTVFDDCGWNYYCTKCEKKYNKGMREIIEEDLKMCKDKELEVVTYEALEVARKTFDEYVESYGFDPAYWDIKFTAWLVSQDLKERLTRIEIEHEVKEDKDGT